MKIKLLLLFLAISLCVSTNAFAEFSFKAEVDKTSISTDETLNYKLTITSDERNLPQPKFPDFKGFAVVSSMQSSNLSFGASKVKTAVSYVFILAPAEIGKLSISPSQITVGDKDYSTLSFEIEVKQGKAPVQAPQAPQGAPQNNLPQSEEPKITL